MNKVARLRALTTAVALLAAAAVRADWQTDRATLVLRELAPGMGSYGTPNPGTGAIHIAIQGNTTSTVFAGAFVTTVQAIDNGVNPPGLVLPPLVYQYPSGSPWAAANPGWEPVTTTLFCMDLTEYVSLGLPGQTAQIVDPATAPRPDVTWNYTGGMGDLREDWLGVLANKYWTPQYLDQGLDPFTNATVGTSNLRYAAMQVAIWEIIYDAPATVSVGNNRDTLPTTWSVTGLDTTNRGDFYLTDSTDEGAALQAEATRILDAIEGWVGTVGLGDANQQYLAAFTKLPNGQDMLGRSRVEIPEPSGLVLAGFGLAGLLCRRKRRV